MSDGLGRGGGGGELWKAWGGNGDCKSILFCLLFGCSQWASTEPASERFPVPLGPSVVREAAGKENKKEGGKKRAKADFRRGEGVGTALCRATRAGKLTCHCCEVSGGEGAWSNDPGATTRPPNNTGCVEFCVPPCCTPEGSSLEP